MTEMQEKKYSMLFGNKTPEEIRKVILAMPDTDEDKAAFYDAFINERITAYTNGFLKYGKNPDMSLLLIDLDRYVRNYEHKYMEALHAFLHHQNRKCLELVSEDLSSRSDEGFEMTEDYFLYAYVGPFKEAFPGFYDHLRKLCDKVSCEDVVKLLCENLDAFYASEDPDQMTDALMPVLQKYPDSVVANALLGFVYYDSKRWGSAIACFEKVEDKIQDALFFDDDIFFFKGWAYGKLREHPFAIRCYEKTLELFPEYEYALNNMGYEYYLLKQYRKALEVFGQCLEQKRDLRFAPDNYVRTLLAMGRAEDAKVFVDEDRYPVRASMKKKIQEAMERGGRVRLEPEEDEGESRKEIPERNAVRKNSGDRFTSERILEDELCARMNAGIPVFGKRLKIYRRHGVYGRQYIIPIGRLDLLAEDREGSLYIIELKKDSGYDDAYGQIVPYLDWFEKHHKGVKVYGIICLNRPDRKLVEKVRRDPRIRLFNYTILYDEIV